MATYLIEIFDTESDLNPPERRKVSKEELLSRVRGYEMPTKFVEAAVTVLMKSGDELIFDSEYELYMGFDNRRRVRVHSGHVDLLPLE